MDLFKNRYKRFRKPPIDDAFLVHLFEPETNNDPNWQPAYIKDENNDYITLPNKTYKQVSINKMKLECHNNNWQYIIKNAV